MSLDKIFPAEIDIPPLLAGFGLAAVSADEQTDVILSHLPAKQSVEYKALRDVAGAIGGQDLARSRPGCR